MDDNYVVVQEVSHKVDFDKYFQFARGMFENAVRLYNQKDYQRAYVDFCKFQKFVVEKLPSHDRYSDSVESMKIWLQEASESASQFIEETSFQMDIIEDLRNNPNSRASFVANVQQHAADIFVPSWEGPDSDNEWGVGSHGTKDAWSHKWHYESSIRTMPRNGAGSSQYKHSGEGSLQTDNRNYASSHEHHRNYNPSPQRHPHHEQAFSRHQTHASHQPSNHHSSSRQEYSDQQFSYQATSTNFIADQSHGSYSSASYDYDVYSAQHPHESASMPSTYQDCILPGVSFEDAAILQHYRAYSM